jgi:galactose oxidase
MAGFGIFDALSASRRVHFFLASCLLLPLFSHPGDAQTNGQTGAWSAVISLPIIPISAALLPNGRVLTWSADNPYTFAGDLGSAPSQTYTSIFDPSTGSSTTTIETSGQSDMFCPGTARLPDGRVLVNGGSSSPKTTIYNPATNTWSASVTMNVPRGYNSDVMLPTGDVFTLGGSWSGTINTDKIGEVWLSSQNLWSARTGISAQPITGPDPEDDAWPTIIRGDNHAWLFTAPALIPGNWRLFHAGPSAEMHWITTSGSGAITDAGPRGDDAYSINGKAVMYDIGKILKVGGAPAYQNASATTATYVIDINGAAATVNKPTAQMNYPRAFANGVVLPNGQVFIVGGQTYAVPFNDANSVLQPELWDPVTETFNENLAPMQTPRNYHSTALLLTDGRVFVAGGGQCGNPCSANHYDAEIFSPPYLFNPDGSAAKRPIISQVPSTGKIGGTISVKSNNSISGFAIVRLSAVTHSVDNDQRRVPLLFTRPSGSSYRLSVPGDPSVVPPGYYMLFAINPQGTPSVASIIKIG